MDKLHLVAGYLVEHEKIDGATFDKLMKGQPEETAPVSDFLNTAENPS